MLKLTHIRWLVPLALVSFVLWRGMGEAAPLVAQTNFAERTPIFDVLLPASRAESTPQGVALVREPVYVDVTLPLRARAATLELKVEPSSAPLKFGFQQGSGWDIAFPDVTVTDGKDARRYTLRVENFSHLEPGYRLRFVVSAPGLAPESIVVQSARVAVERQPFSWGWFSALMRRFPQDLL